MVGENIKSRDLYSYRYRGEESADLPEEFRRRLFYLILDGYKWFRYKLSTADTNWAAVAEVSGVEYKQEAGARDLVATVIRMRGLPRLPHLTLHYRWLEQYLLTQPTEFCLDVIDILLSEWWRDEKTVSEVNELFQEYELPYEVKDYRVERRGPALARRIDKKIQVAKSRLAGFSPAAFEALEEAERALRTGEDENDWSRVGHQCRLAFQDFAEAAYQTWYPNAEKEPLPLDKTLNKTKAVLSEFKSKVSKSHWELVSAMLEPVNEIIQKIEHRSAKEREPLTETDAERCFVMTALLIEEALTLFSV